MGSTMFLSSCGESLHIANQTHGAQIDTKGKGKLREGAGPGKTTIHRQHEHKQKQDTWLAPPSGWVKINTDAAFCQGTGRASVGVVASKQKDEVILSAWRFSNTVVPVKRRKQKPAWRVCTWRSNGFGGILSMLKQTAPAQWQPFVEEVMKELRG
jgi:hypothetical protein